jgi:hypothetical protein
LHINALEKRQKTPKAAGAPWLCKASTGKGKGLNMPQLCEMGLKSFRRKRHDRCILRRRKQTRLEITTRAGIKKEMAQPRMARSARIAELNLRTARIHEPPSTSMPGKVDKIIRSRSPSKTRKKGAHVEITVTSKDVKRRK